jgi:transposase
LAKALSVDLRSRVVDAMEAAASCQAAAARFGVGQSSAIRWVVRARTRGNLSTDRRGGNHRSHWIGAQRVLVLGWVEAKTPLVQAEGVLR